MDITKIKQNYYYAVDFIEEKIKEELDEFGDNGLELNYRTEEEGYSVTEEIEPNVFKVVRKVRVHYDELQVIVEGETEWSDIMGITDWVFFLEEVMCAIDAEYELCNR
jgi:hypothetical protein